MASIPDLLASTVISLSERGFEQKYGGRRLLRVSWDAIEGDIVTAIKTGQINTAEDSLLQAKLMTVGGNRWLTAPRKQTRDVQLCIVSLAPVPAHGCEQRLSEQLSHLSKQTFANWNLVTFVEGLSAVSKKVGERAVLVNASVYEGLNLQRAATKYCDPSAVMFLLDHDETLASDSGLQTLADHFTPIGVFAAFV
jgi:hypothetical protein